MMLKKRSLGRGLNELGLNELLSSTEAAPSNANKPAAKISGELTKLGIELLQSGKYQPRQDFDPEALQELADSIRAQGIIQPIVVRKIANKKYEIIAGERRWRAAQLAGLHDVPVVIRDIPDEAAMAIGLIENIQRQDLNAIEQALALQRLLEEFEMTHQDIAQAVGKSRVTVTNLLRLLSLNEDVKFLLQNNQIEMGHARALLALTGDQQSEIAKSIFNKGLSVRETEQLIRNLEKSNAKPKVNKRIDPDVQRLQNRLSDKLGAAVTIQHSVNGKGKLVIQYNTLDELEGILEHIQ